MTKRLRKVEVINPPTTTTAIEVRKLGSAPQPRTIGIMPETIATVDMTIGRTLLRHASSGNRDTFESLSKSSAKYSMPVSKPSSIGYSILGNLLTARELAGRRELLRVYLAIGLA